MKFTPGIMAVSKAAELVLTPLNLAGQTRIGNMTGGGGLEAAFTGVTNDIAANSPSSSINNTGWGSVGTILPVAKRIGQIKVYGTNNNGFFSTDPVVTLRTYGRLGSNPVTGTDGTMLSTETFTDTNNQSAGRTYTITDTNVYDRVWAALTQDTATARICAITEIQIWELV